MTTETLPTIHKKNSRYVDYWRSGVEQQRHGVFPRVVWLVQSAQRGHKIAETIGKLATDTRALFHVGLIEKAAQTLAGVEENPLCA